ncbi:MAG: hypothetical protein LBH13_06475 [Cellulomonadaceae bacterium]|jgi:hypothetical protein|nr:hypothetical protein [Cellulomonadaceae bacterium]
MTHTATAKSNVLPFRLRASTDDADASLGTRYYHPTQSGHEPPLVDPVLLAGSMSRHPSRYGRPSPGIHALLDATAVRSVHNGRLHWDAGHSPHTPDQGEAA